MDYKILRLPSHISEDSIRKQFEDYYGKRFDLTKEYNDWSKTYVYIHPHIESCWLGWLDANKWAFANIEKFKSSVLHDIVDEIEQAGATLMSAQEDGCN